MQKIPRYEIFCHLAVLPCLERVPWCRVALTIFVALWSNDFLKSNICCSWGGAWRRCVRACRLGVLDGRHGAARKIYALNCLDCKLALNQLPTALP
jgi:hypothetical protein